MRTFNLMFTHLILTAKNAVPPRYRTTSRRDDFFLTGDVQRKDNKNILWKESDSKYEMARKCCSGTIVLESRWMENERLRDGDIERRRVV